MKVASVPILLSLVATACNEPLTQVVVAVTSDLSVPAEVDGVMMFHQPGDQAPAAFAAGLGGSIASFPVSATFYSGHEYPTFSISVQLTQIVITGQRVVVGRKATGIRFVDGETRMLVLAMPRACACAGTTCPNPEDQPECASLADPPLEPLDPALAPRAGAGGAPPVAIR